MNITYSIHLCSLVSKTSRYSGILQIDECIHAGRMDKNSKIVPYHCYILSIDI